MIASVQCKGSSSVTTKQAHELSATVYDCFYRMGALFCRCMCNSSPTSKALCNLPYHARESKARAVMIMYQIIPFALEVEVEHARPRQTWSFLTEIHVSYDQYRR